jgi:flagellar L-ring protein precursor FlgH
MTREFLTPSAKSLVPVLGLILLLGLGACAAPKQTPSAMPKLTPPPEVAPEASQNPGSLYSNSSGLLFEDTRARRVGDIVVVNIMETSSGEHEAETDASRETTTKYGVGAYFRNSTVAALPVGSTLGMGASVGTNPAVEANSSSELQASGSTSRNSELAASVAARVIKIMANGLLQVEGAREMRINEENQVLMVSGLIRPEDINPDNSIPSTRIADARIEYYGQGTLADKQKSGWMTRILDNIWPF